LLGHCLTISRSSAGRHFISLQGVLALLEAAERAVQAGGVDAVSVRGVAEEAGTTTRAVYSLFGSKEGLLVALGARAFEMLGSAVRALPETEDPAEDLVEAGVAVFRRFVTEHPILFRIGFQHRLAPPERAAEFDAARLDALAGLVAKVTRLKRSHLLGGRTVPDATAHFDALCEGLADMELRGTLPPGEEEHIWRDALSALVAGLAVPARRRRPRTPATNRG
jgi:AcrR family transcriptional regulator